MANVELDRKTVDTDVAVRVYHPEEDKPPEEGLEFPDCIGYLMVPLSSVLDSLVDDVEHTDSYSLQSELHPHPGKVHMGFLYRTHVILSDEEYEPLLALLESHSFLILRLLSLIHPSVSADLLPCFARAFSYRHRFIDLVSTLVRDHVTRCDDVTGRDVFRGDTVSSGLFELYMKNVAGKYLTTLLGPFFNKLINEDLDCEVRQPNHSPCS